MKYFTFLATLIALIHSIQLNAQVTQEWVQRYTSSGNSPDRAYKIKLDNNSNLYVAGNSKKSGTAYDYDICLIKYSSSGVQQWIQKYDGQVHSYDRFNDMCLDDSGNVYITGLTSSGDNQLRFFDYCTLKYNTNGILQWVKTYDGTYHLYDEANSITIDGSGNIYVTGVSTMIGTGQDYCTIKYSRNGNFLWLQRFGSEGSRTDQAFFIESDLHSNIYVSGISSGTGWDCSTVKYDSMGNQKWAETYNGPGNWGDYLFSMTLDRTGNIYIAGRSDGSSTMEDYFVIKYNPSGVQQWVRWYNGPANNDDEARCIKTDNDLNVYVTGSSIGNGTSDDYCTIKYDSSGVQQWVQRYNGTANDMDIANTMTLDTFNNIYVAGWSRGQGSYEDITIVKYTPSGQQVWVERYNSPYNLGEVAYDILFQNSKVFYVTGYSVGPNGDDFITIKYAQVVGIKPQVSKIPDIYRLYQNYPNPFNGITLIFFDLPKESRVDLRIYNILGEEVSELLDDEYFTAGTVQFGFDSNKEELSSGVYFYRLTARTADKKEIFIDTKKMVLIK